ncbi:MAG: polysaccharide biosynthesis/export family protein [Steroidobacteraceae bacterium]
MTKMKRTLLMGLLLGAMTSLAVAADVASSANGAEAEYLLQPGDILGISVWKEEELKADVLIRPDGGLSFPLAGDVRAAGGTIAQLQVLLSQRLSKFIPDPVVTVALKQIGGNRIYVLGKVARPGEFAFAKSVDVMQALSLAGGTTPFADLNSIRVLRRSSLGQQTTFEFHYDEVERGRNLGQNLLLQSGDTVIVP